MDLLLAEEEQEPDKQTPTISLHAMTGIPHEETMKLHVAIGNQNLQLLLILVPLKTSSKSMWLNAMACIVKKLEVQM